MIRYLDWRMKARLRILSWWASCSLAVLGVLLATAFVVLDIRSRSGTDQWLLHYMYPTNDESPRWRWWNVGILSASGTLKTNVALLHCAPGEVGGGPMWPEPWLYYDQSRSSMPTLLPPFDYQQRHEAWNGLGSQRRLSITLPIWLLGLLSALPAALLLYLRWRGRNRRSGFPVVPADPPSSSSPDIPPGQ